MGGRMKLDYNPPARLRERLFKDRFRVCLLPSWDVFRDPVGAKPVSRKPAQERCELIRTRIARLGPCPPPVFDDRRRQERIEIRLHLLCKLAGWCVLRAQALVWTGLTV